MPNSIAHLDIALELATQFPIPVIEANLGSFLLGSCSPDIRVITRGQRDDTHFAPLSNATIGAGTSNLFAAHPNLSHAATLSGPTQAFMAGYISHLVADEAWIIQVYRPYFANRALFNDPVEANVMDRALQLDMDRCARDKPLGMKRIMDCLPDSHVGVSVGFLPAETLAEWREWLVAATQREFTWERLRGLATRRQDPQELDRAKLIADRFLADPQESLERIYTVVPRAALVSYRDTIAREWANIVRRYLP
ncbi:MAG: zinc dependent phospholipase C family protein [Chloroflexota bacterium]